MVSPATKQEPSITDDLRQIREQLTDVFERVAEVEGPFMPTRQKIISSIASIDSAIFNSEMKGY